MRIAHATLFHIKGPRGDVRQTWRSGHLSEDRVDLRFFDAEEGLHLIIVSSSVFLWHFIPDVLYIVYIFFQFSSINFGFSV